MSLFATALPNVRWYDPLVVNGSKLPGSLPRYPKRSPTPSPVRIEATPGVSDNILERTSMPSIEDQPVKAFLLDRVDTTYHSSQKSISPLALKLAIDEQKKQRKGVTTTQRPVLFINTGPELEYYLSECSVDSRQCKNNLPDELSLYLDALGISEERLANVMSLTPSAHYQSEQDNFFAFCLPEFHLNNTDSNSIHSTHDVTDKLILEPKPVRFLFNRHFTIVIYDGKSNSVNKFINDFETDQLAYLKRRDRFPCVSTLVKDILENNRGAVMFTSEMFRQLKSKYMGPHSIYALGGFQLALSNMQDYFISEERPDPPIKTMIKHIVEATQKYGSRSTLNNEPHVDELKRTIGVTLSRVKMLEQDIQLRSEIRTGVVDDQKRFIEATLAGLGVAFLPNGVVTQLPINGWVAVAAHGLASILSLTWLYNMKKLRFFDFVEDILGHTNFIDFLLSPFQVWDKKKSNKDDLS